jgi:putative ABC transport system ATP-binding protein
MAAAVSLSSSSRAEAEPIVELSNVSKDYDTGGGVVHAMRDVDLCIAQGEFVAIVGTSGSGKSTMMNILGCLDRPTRGTYTLCGIDVGSRGGDSRAIVRNRVIGFIFQGFNLLPRTTALENCELPLQYRGVGTRQRRRRAKAALAAVGLGDRMDHKPNQLSGGQQQRVAIARALVTDPPLLLADEPTGNLDTRTSLEVLALLQRLNRDRGITIVLVTHERDIAACASRVITMRDGRIVSDVVQDAPVDAAAELASLPLPDTGAGESRADDTADAGASAKARVGGTVPFSVYPMMLLGEVLGAGAMALYVRLVLGVHEGRFMLLPPLAGEIGKAFLGARWARRRLGGPTTPDQRVRMALGYTITTLSVQAALLVAIVMLLPMAQSRLIPLLDHIPSGGAVAGAEVVCGVLAVTVFLVLLRYLLLSLFNPQVRTTPRRATRLTEGA